jgi:hypothetical protein
LVGIGVLEKETDYSSKWSSPSFEIPKKNGTSTIRVVTDFRKLDLLLKRRLSPISYSNDRGTDMIRSMEWFTFASESDLNIGYYHIKLDADAQKLCTIVFSWHLGKNKYKRLPMGIKIDWFLMFFKTSCLRLSKIWNMLRPK